MVPADGGGSGTPAREASAARPGPLATGLADRLHGALVSFQLRKLPFIATIRRPVTTVAVGTPGLRRRFNLWRHCCGPTWSRLWA